MTLARRLRAVVLRVVSLAGRARGERELADELEGHLQLHTDDFIRAGLSPAEARRRAILALGGVEQAKEQYRDRRGLPWLEAVLQDARYGLRMLLRQKTFTAVAVVTLAIGFGPPIAIFMLANWMVLRPVPGVRDTSRVSLYMSGTPSPGGTGTRVGRISYLNLRDILPRLRTVSLAGFQRSSAAVAANGRPERFVPLAFVSASYFDVLGVTMHVGRPLGPGDDDPGRPGMTAVISDGLWSALFARDPSAVGNTTTANGHTLTVVGVAEPEFQGVRRFSMEGLWLPGVTEPLVKNMRERRPDDRALGGYYEFAGRLAPGATRAQVDTELALATAWLLEQFPEENGKFKEVGFHDWGPIDALGREPLALLVSVMFAASLLVLLIASSNVASLLLMRGVARRGEVAVRQALGAGRWRTVRQHVTEATLLWLLGGVAGTLVVWGILQIGVTSRLSLLGVPALPLGLDRQAVAFALGLALLVGVLFSMVPAWRVTNVKPAVVLQASSAASTRRFRILPLFTVVQLAASLALFVGALMLGLTVRNLMAVDLGFDPRNVTVFNVQPPSGASPEAAYSYVTQFRTLLAARPGVTSVAVATGAPLAGAGSSFTRIRPAGGDEFTETPVHQVLSPEFFSLLRIAVLRGRSFLPEEVATLASPRGTSVILNETLARSLFGTADVVGRRIEIPQYQQAPRSYAIVGVVADVRQVNLTDAPPPTVYTPEGVERLISGTTLIARADDARPLAAEIEGIAQSLRTPPPAGIRTLEEAVAGARVEWDLLAELMVLLAAIASVVAAVGVYGVV